MHSPAPPFEGREDRGHLRVTLLEIAWMGAFVYILKCSDGSFYVGSATGDDLEPRIAQHNTGYFQGYTSSRLPVELVWSEHFQQIVDAIAMERRLKGWSRAKKQALINGDWKTIELKAKRRGGRPKPSPPSS